MIERIKHKWESKVQIELIKGGGNVIIIPYK
jgi:hypothetical protein